MGMKPSTFSVMTREELILFCKGLVEKNGPNSVSYQELKKIKGLYWALYQNGLRQRILLKTLGIEDEFNQNKRLNFSRVSGGRVQKGWTWDRILSDVNAVISELGFLPPASWFVENGRGSLVQATYYLGHTWASLYEHFGPEKASTFVPSRNKMRWHSVAEACLSNFLHARKIVHGKGKKYPESYSKEAGRTYGIFDLFFIDKNGNSIDVEVWGDRPYGHDEADYAKKRASKEKFNKGNPKFLGLHYKTCYNEIELQKALTPFIGIVAPTAQEMPYDDLIPTTNWSSADELIAHCKVIASEQPDGIFPSEGWLRKRNKYKNRSGPAYNTLSVYIKLWLGGVRKLRIILGQEDHSLKVYSKEKVLAEVKLFYEKYGFMPHLVKSHVMMGTKEYTDEEIKIARSLEALCRNYIGTLYDTYVSIGVKPSRRAEIYHNKKNRLKLK